MLAVAWGGECKAERAKGTGTRKGMVCRYGDCMKGDVSSRGNPRTNKPRKGKLDKEDSRSGDDLETPHVEEAVRGLEIADVAIGYAHTVVLTTGGGVLSWGDNAKGQFGTRSREIRR